MKLIILPGNAKSNEMWANDSADAFSDTSADIHQQRYSHWDTGEKLIDFDAELKKLSEAVKNEHGYVIFGKSAGAMLAIYGVYKGEIKPERCVFVGLPIHWASKYKFPLDEWLEKFDVPTVLAQQSEDPLASFNEVRSLLSKLKKDNMRIVEIPGNDHEYNDFSLIKGETTNFLFNKEKEKDIKAEGEEKFSLK